MWLIEVIQALRILVEHQLMVEAQRAAVTICIFIPEFSLFCLVEISGLYC